MSGRRIEHRPRDKGKESGELTTPAVAVQCSLLHTIRTLSLFSSSASSSFPTIPRTAFVRSCLLDKYTCTGRPLSSTSSVVGATLGGLPIAGEGEFWKLRSTMWTMLMGTDVRAREVRYEREAPVREGGGVRDEQASTEARYDAGY